jgi:alkylation response protein AidB-like acyl-CoA dehydrogenase
VTDPITLAAAFVDEISSRAADIERARRMPDDLAHRMAQAGLFRMLVPTRYGGLECHPQRFVDTLERVARADGAVGWVLMIGSTTGVCAASLAEPWAKRVYAEEPDTITCGVTAPLGRAVAAPGGIVVSGRWPFGSGCHVADWICGGTLTLENGKPITDKRGAPEARLVFFEKTDVTIHDNWDTAGLRGTGSNDIEVRDVFVPDGRWSVLGGRPHVDEPLYRFPTLGLLALGVSAVALGIARHALDTFVEMASDKVPTGSARALANRPSVQEDVALAAARLDAARALTREAIDRAWQEAQGSGRLALETKARLRLAAVNNTWSAVDVVDRLYHAAGGSSVYSTNDLQRCFRDVHVATQHIMVARPVWEVVGRVLLGQDPRTLL